MSEIAGVRSKLKTAALLSNVTYLQMGRATLMPPERWQQAQDLFHEALDHTPEARTAFLMQACPDDVLRAEVQALLNADDAPPSLFKTTPEQTSTLHTNAAASSSAHRPNRPNNDSGLDRLIGPYRLVREIGRGGMGTVYLAQRTDLLNDVALKIVRASLADPENVARFLREQRLLAHLEHPHIARLFDAGVTDEQTPYFVMEFVEGRPITAFCDEHQLTISERLRLFQTVCQTVHYAHQNLIVHRDLKPANILVTDQGTVKLLDFGIAKLIEEDDEAQGLTRTGMRLMTPEYAAPEQVRGDPVTTATDVYALGVLLYELLTGHRPYRLGGRTLGEIERVICEQQPVRPSVAARRYPVLTRTGGTSQGRPLESIRSVRVRNAMRLRRRLEGDLDVICLKALSKEAPRRYASAEALGVDVDRHLSGVPVQARASTMGYRAHKFVQRHQVELWVTAALMVVLAVLIGGFTLQLAEERDGARIEAEKAAQLSSFLMHLFEASHPNKAVGEEVTARELLARGVARAEALKDQPEVQAQLLDVVGQVYRSLGQYDKAQPLLEQGLALRRAYLGEEHPDIAESLENLAVLTRYQGDYEHAELLFREALAMQRKLLGDEHPDLARTLSDLAILLRRQGDYEEADALYHEALAMQRKLLGSAHPDVAHTLNNLAVLKRHQRDYETAERYYREALGIWHRLQGTEHPEIARLLNNLATLLSVKGDDGAAEPLFREALAMRRKLLGEQHPDTPVSMLNLASLLRRNGAYDEAEALYREALAARREIWGAEHLLVARTLNNLGLALDQKGELEEAEACYREALAIKRKVLDKEHPELGSTLVNLALLLQGRGDYPAAAPLLLETLTLYQNRYGQEHKRVRDVRTNLDALYEAWGKPEQAALYQEPSPPLE